MKYSDDTEEHRKANIDYVNQRWKQLHSLEMDFSSEGIKYLLLVNSGAAVAILAFHGSVASIRDMIWPKVMLGFYVTGVILIGMLHVARYIGISSLFKNWRDLANEYFTDTRDWNDVIANDIKKSKRFYWVPYFAYASFACFIVSSAIGMFNFSTLTSGENHGRKEAITTTSAKTNTPSTTTINGNTGQRTETFGDAKHSGTTSPSKKEIKSVIETPTNPHSSH